MEHIQKVIDIMVPLEKHPRISHTSTVGEALNVIRNHLHEGYRHVLVYNQDKLVPVSVFTIKSILKAMILDFMQIKKPSGYEGYAVEYDESLSVFWQESFFMECRKVSQIPLSEISTPEIITVDADAPLTKALSRMINKDVSMMPVIKDGVVIGVVHLSSILNLCSVRTCSSENTNGEN